MAQKIKKWLNLDSKFRFVPSNIINRGNKPCNDIICGMHIILWVLVAMVLIRKLLFIVPV